jgi:hypothetical protein
MTHPISIYPYKNNSVIPTGALASRSEANAEWWDLL